MFHQFQNVHDIRISLGFKIEYIIIIIIISKFSRLDCWIGIIKIFTSHVHFKFLFYDFRFTLKFKSGSGKKKKVQEWLGLKSTSILPVSYMI